MSEFTKDHMAAAIDAEQGRDLIITDMVINHEYSLNAATKRYAELAKEAGIATGRTSRRKEALEQLDISAPLSADEIGDMCTGVAHKLGITAKTVAGYLKEYYEAKDWHWPAAGSASEAILDWLVAHNECTKEQFEGFMATAAEDGGKRSQSNINEYWKGMTLHRRIIKLQSVQAEQAED